MSTHQQSKFCRAKKSITEESGRPGTCRSNVGCAAMDEPCTNRMVPAVCCGSPADFSNMNSFAPPSLVVQWSSPLIAAAGFVISFIVHLINESDVVGLDHLSPFGDFRLHEGGEHGLCHHHGGGALFLPGVLDVLALEDVDDGSAERIDNRLRRRFRRHEADPQRRLETGHAG